MQKLQLAFLFLLFVPLISSCSDAEMKTKYYAENCPVSTGYDWPVGKPGGKGYYNAQPFTANDHLGEDLNGAGGGNSDLGDPVYSVSEGIVSVAKDFGGGWGNIVRIVHNNGTKDKPELIESFYAHLDKIIVKEGEIVKRGQQIGTIGTAHGKYLAHLHFEIRSIVDMPTGLGYSKDTTGYLNAIQYLKTH